MKKLILVLTMATISANQVADKIVADIGKGNALLKKFVETNQFVPSAQNCEALGHLFAFIMGGAGHPTILKSNPDHARAIQEKIGLILTALEKCPIKDKLITGSVKIKIQNNAK